MDYEEMSEPNMKLSRALLIVLVLHVVAVAGIIAFNTIKTRQGPPPPLSNASLTAPVSAKPEIASPDSGFVSKSVRPPAKPLAKDDHRVEHAAKPAEKISGPPDSTKTYVVAKGDNPVTIARKMKVSYDDLIAANHIEDPHKLQIGQKLIIPTKVMKAKKVEDQ